MTDEPVTGWLSDVQDCAALYRPAGWKWNDWQCSLVGFNFKFVCQYDMLAAPSTPSPEALPSPEVVSPSTSTHNSTLGIGGQSVSGIERLKPQEQREGVLLGTGALIGIALGAFILLLMLLVFVISLFCRLRRQKTSSSPQATVIPDLRPQMNPVFYSVDSEQVSTYDNNLIGGRAGFVNDACTDVTRDVTLDVTRDVTCDVTRPQRSVRGADFEGRLRAPSYREQPPRYAEKSPLPLELCDGYALHHESGDVPTPVASARSSRRRMYMNQFGDAAPQLHTRTSASSVSAPNRHVYINHMEEVAPPIPSKNFRHSKTTM